MERDQAIAALKAHQAELMQLGVQGLYLFGSTARGEARKHSYVACDRFVAKATKLRVV